METIVWWQPQNMRATFNCNKVFRQLVISKARCCLDIVSRPKAEIMSIQEAYPERFCYAFLTPYWWPSRLQDTDWWILSADVLGRKQALRMLSWETICSTNWSILVKLPNIMFQPKARSFEESNLTSNTKPPKLVHSPCHAMILCKEIECPILPRQKTEKNYKNTTKRSSPCGHGVLGQCCVTKLRELE